MDCFEGMIVYTHNKHSFHLTVSGCLLSMPADGDIAHLPGFFNFGTFFRLELLLFPPSKLISSWLAASASSSFSSLL